MMGGGRLNFLPNTTTDDQGNRGRRWDGRNLIDEWKNDKNSKGFLHKYVSKRTDFLQVDSEKIDYLFGMFASDDLSFNLKAETTLQPTLEEMVEKAIKILSRDDRGYFLFVEGN